MKDNNTVVLKVAGACTVTFGTCAYDKGATITVTNSNNDTVGTLTLAAGDGATDSTTLDFSYTGSADTLTFTWTASAGQNYLHSVKVTNK